MSSSPVDDHLLRSILQLARRLGAERAPGPAAAVIEARLAELVLADRAVCAYWDNASSSVWHPSGEVASAPLSPTDRFEPRAMQVRVVDQDGEVHAILGATREPSRPPFEAVDVAVLRRLATEIAPMLRRLALEVALGVCGADEVALRPEALAARRDVALDGQVLRVVPRWVDWAYPMALLSPLLAATGLGLVTVPRDVAGPAVVVMEDRVEARAPVEGVLTRVDVVVGARVGERQPIARVRDLDGIERVVTAPSVGRVVSLRARPGHWVAAGATIGVLSAGDEPPRWTAVFPDAERPRIAPGMPAWFIHNGQDLSPLVVEEVDPEVVSAQEGARYLGGDALAGPSMLLWLRARHGGGSAAAWPHGTRGVVEVRAGEERLWEALLPRVIGAGW